MKKLILFLIRRKLKLKKFESFRFKGQKSKTDFYFFTNESLMKVTCDDKKYGPLTSTIDKSNVSLNWLLDDECEIILCRDELLKTLGYDKLANYGF